MTDRTSGVYYEQETWPAERLAAWKWERISAVMAAAWAAGSPFRDRLAAIGAEVGDIHSYDDFVRIPPLSKKQLMTIQAGDFEGLISCPPGKLSRVYLSPGPLLDPEGREPDYWAWTEAFYAAGFRENDLVQNTFSYHLTPAGIMLEEPLIKMGCAVIPAGPGNTDTQADLMTRLRPTGFVGMTSFLRIIGEKIVERGLDPQTACSLKVAFVLAEMLTPSLRRHVQELFGMRIRQGYGTADVGSIAYECTEITGMHLSTRRHVEICEPGTGRPLPVGEVGEVVVTSFSPTYPLVRLATGDLSRLVGGECACGRTSPRLEGVLGRADATAKVKGQFLYPHQIREVMSRFPEIRGWQAVITNPEARDVLTLTLDAPEALDAGAVARAFQDALKLRPVVERDDSGRLREAGLAPLVDRRTWD